jgi:Uncharacterized protein conserved in bacteria (DUF2147)
VRSWRRSSEALLLLALVKVNVDGYVYNPRDGDMYRMNAELTGPNALEIRGYPVVRPESDVDARGVRRRRGR